MTLRGVSIHNGLLIGRVINLSLSGLAMESSTGLRTGSRHSFRLILRQKRYAIEAEVRWCRLVRTVGQRPGDFAPVFRTGLAFNRPLKLFAGSGRKENGEWFDPEVRVGR